MTYEDLGFLAIARGDHQEAVNIFRRALEQSKEGRAYLGLGMASFHLGDLPLARWALHRALEREPNNKQALENLARVEQGNISPLPASASASRFRAGAGSIEVFDGEWKKLFVKGINLGLGVPGHFPGEFAVGKATYLKWFRRIADLGANTVRVYTIMMPGFYEALDEFNRASPAVNRLCLLQEIWTELPEDQDFSGAEYEEGVRTEIRNAVDVIFGNAVLPERPGHPHGSYKCDLSPHLAGFIFGVEWDPHAVRGYNDRQGRGTRNFKGTFLDMRRGTPFEVWITGMCDYLQQYEEDRYGITHPVTTVNWPTLDPLSHPSEATTEEEFRRQGMTPAEGWTGGHREDEETLDVAKIISRKGAGFFALYHVYPNYPDFMNHDYLGEADPYGAYLRELKRHHGDQPVLIGEFGVPSSRESAHWHQHGWSHGGHSERRQGEINARLMRSIRDAGMAGGSLFSWFDEWFKRSWLFHPYLHPAERNPLWFNFQDPEQNYGLLAAYPGYPKKAVTLAGRREEWKKARVLYEKKGAGATYRFSDGFDGARTLVRLAAQHDEGFLYLLLETAAPVDFDHAHYLICLDTTCSGLGERRLPFRTGVESPVGLTFLIHLAGRGRNRILCAKAYDKYLNEKRGVVRPEASREGAWVMMQNQTNVRRISKDGTRFYPARAATMSRLRFGSLDPRSPEYDSLADVYVQGNRIELRIPWGLINFTDPSSRSVLWMEKGGKTKTTEGIRMLAVSYMPARGGIAAAETGGENNIADSLPTSLAKCPIALYSWQGWDTPVYHSYEKESYHLCRMVFREMPEVR